MEKTLRQIMRELLLKGHSVKYYERYDGGIVITKIDGVKYTGKKGNKAARLMVGSTLSEAREYQLSKLPSAKGLKPSERKRSKLPENLEKELKSVQRQWKKQHDSSKGFIGKNSVRYVYETMGEAEATASLDRARRYATGYAYIENVEAFIQVVSNYASKKPSQDIFDVINTLENHKNNMKIDDLNNMIDKWYDDVVKMKKIKNFIDFVKALYPNG